MSSMDFIELLPNFVLCHCLLCAFFFLSCDRERTASSGSGGSSSSSNISSSSRIDMMALVLVTVWAHNYIQRNIKPFCNKNMWWRAHRVATPAITDIWTVTMTMALLCRFCVALLSRTNTANTFLSSSVLQTTNKCSAVLRPLTPIWIILTNLQPLKSCLLNILSHVWVWNMVAHIEGRT